MRVISYVNCFPEIAHLSELEQRQLLKAAHRRLFSSWKSWVAIYAFAAFLVLSCVSVGVGVASITAWSQWVGGAASVLMMLVVLFLFERSYARQLHRTLRQTLSEHSAGSKPTIFG